MWAPRWLSRLPPLSFLVLFLGSWVYLFQFLLREWNYNPQYGYGFFVPILCALVLWQRRRELRTEEISAERGESMDRRLKWALFGAACLLLPYELFRQVAPALRSILYLALAICLLFSWWTLKRLGFARIPSLILGTTALFLTAIPWPATLEVHVTHRLVGLVTKVVVSALNFSGVWAESMGNLVILTGGVVKIDEACSGIRSLQSCIMASVALGVFFRLRLRQGILLLATGLCLALIGNFLRTFLLSMYVAIWGPANFDRVHDPAGWIILIVATLVLYFIARQWERPEAVTSGPATLRGLHLHQLPALTLACVVGLLSLFSARWWYAFHDSQWVERNTPHFSVRKNLPETVMSEVVLPQHILAQLRPDNSLYYNLFNSNLGHMALYSFFWKPSVGGSVAFVHRPDVCMPGAGWKQTGDARKILVPISGGQTEWLLFNFERGDEKVIQAWGVWREGIPQELHLSQNLGGWFVQYRQRWELVSHGRRRANAEIISLVADAKKVSEPVLVNFLSNILEINLQ
jgi:exosortase